MHGYSHIWVVQTAHQHTCPIPPVNLVYVRQSCCRSRKTLVDSTLRSISSSLDQVCTVLECVQAVLKDTNTVEIVDVASGMSDSLDFSEQVDAFAMGHGRLVVATGRQARVYTISISGGATLAPAASVDIGDMLLEMKLASRCFLLLFASAGPQVWRPARGAQSSAPHTASPAGVYRSLSTPCDEEPEEPDSLAALPP